MNSKLNCTLCLNNCEEYSGQYDNTNSTIHSCRNCGTVPLSTTLIAILQSSDPETKFALSCFCKRKTLSEGDDWFNQSGSIKESQVKSIAEATNAKDILEKLDEILEYLRKKTDWLFQRIKIKPTDFFYFYCRNEKEMWDCIRYLNEKGYLDTKNGETELHIPWLTPEGFNYIKEHKSATQCFVAMWFEENEPNMQEIYESTFSPAINDAGFDPYKIDMVDDFTNEITDQMIAEIKRSKFVIADLTGVRGGVYFEAGYAMGRGLKVIFTCEEGWFDEIHFDVRQRPVIKWKNTEDGLHKFKQDLTNKINALID